MFKSILLVGAGGFVGSVLRFLVTKQIQMQVASTFPWGTFAVNVVGSFIIGIVYAISEKTGLLTPDIRLFLAVGLCGGFTTFSSLSNDAFLLLQGKEILMFTAYMAFSFVSGLLAVFAGRLVVNQLV